MVPLSPCRRRSYEEPSFRQLNFIAAGRSYSTTARTPKAMTQQTGSDRTAIRPFHVNVPEAELTELRRRINATRWPERETVTDASQGVQFATMQKLAQYWEKEYNWRRCETRLNALPNFITE